MIRAISYHVFDVKSTKLATCCDKLTQINTAPITKGAGSTHTMQIRFLHILHIRFHHINFIEKLIRISTF